METLTTLFFVLVGVILVVAIVLVVLALIAIIFGGGFILSMLGMLAKFAKNKMNG